MTALLVANDGGHLMQLFRLAPRLSFGSEVEWMTVRTPQSESLLKEQVVHWMHPAPTRDASALVRNIARGARVLRHREFAAVVSTGASLALSIIPLARARGIPGHYIESATRVNGPSLTGKILSALPGVLCYTQHPAWLKPGWRFSGSVLDGFEQHLLDGDLGAKRLSRVVVSLGTSETFGFRRLLEHLVSIMPPGVDVLWQTGSTDVSGLAISARERVPASELFAAMRAADVVIAHAGTGSALAAFEAGKFPILVPRRPDHGEHVDDHQLQIAGLIDRLGVGLVREVSDLKQADLMTAAQKGVRTAPHLRKFVLGGRD